MVGAGARLLSNLWASLAVLGLIAAISYGLPAVDRALPGDRPVAPGQPYPVGAGVIVVPPPHALVDLTRTRPGADRGTAEFVLGTVRYTIAVGPYNGTLDDAAARLRRRITERRGYQVTSNTERVVATLDGVPGRQGGYTAPGQAGRYAAFVVRGLAIEVTVSGTGSSVESSLDAIGASVATIAYRGTG